MPILSNLLTGALVASAAVVPAATVSAHVQTRHAQGMPTTEHRAEKLGQKILDLKNMTVGKVTAVSGATITIEGRENKTFTIDTSGATLLKGNPRDPATITLSDIKVGDMVMARGTVDGTSVKATEAHLMGAPHDMKPFGGERGEKPTAGGKVTAVNGSTITIQDRDEKTYTIDATNAKLTSGFRDTTTIVVSDIKVGDMVMTHGTLNGTTVTATDVHDMGTLPEPGKGFGKKMGRFHLEKQQ